LASCLLGALMPILIAGAVPASAHSSVLTSSPANGAAVGKAPTEVAFRFDSPLLDGFASVSVTGPDGSPWQSGKPKVSGATLVQELNPLGPAGTYEVAYRVVSADGHPVTGASTFRLTTAAAASAGEQASDDHVARAAASDAGESGGSGLIPRATELLAVVLLLVALGLMAARRKRPTGSH
jgi:copper resistance protein C